MTERHCATAWLALAWSVFVSYKSATALSNFDDPLHTVVTDPVGDVKPDSHVTILPDLTSATVDVADGYFTFVVRFAPRTVDRDVAKLTWLRIELDTDVNSSVARSRTRLHRNRRRDSHGIAAASLAVKRGRARIATSSAKRSRRRWPIWQMSNPNSGIWRPR
jgi:hypothetical protein